MRKQQYLVCPLACLHALPVVSASGTDLAEKLASPFRCIPLHPRTARWPDVNVCDGLQAGACVDEAPFAVDVSELVALATDPCHSATTAARPGQPATQSQSMATAGSAALPFMGRFFCLDAIEDAAERRQAKEYIRELGGQV